MLTSRSSTAASSPPSSPVFAESEEDEERLNRSKTEEKAKKKSLADQYPPGIPRITRLGKCTYGINTGPLPDDGVDWAKLSVAVLKEQLAMRNMPDDGKKADLVERLTNVKTYKPDTVRVREPAPEADAFGPISQLLSSKGERRSWISPDEKGHINSVKKAMQEPMHILKLAAYGLHDQYGGPKSISLSLRGSTETYGVTIATQTSCDCTSFRFRPGSNCKHIIYVLTHVLRAPAELLPQRTLFAEELSKLIDNAPKVRFTPAEVSSNPALSNGVPKPKDGKSCPVCYKDLGEQQAVCCAKCGHSAHSSCFAVYSVQLAGWGLNCPVCQNDWAAAAV
ncbi:hypothetical protein CCHL11_04889 [Colletotrichum chlorophyti]|uniref:Postreplication repair E3 ubiquitin-protein ligase RAD18 n=1 Tax=Colletotrichum chlorophyti TaxID=708187 RepID=A0A1Q8S2N8_9PEZI|nr:hypothetical protein CCHL11_04889 [Colletotrichum chlorophyti]